MGNGIEKGNLCRGDTGRRFFVIQKITGSLILIVLLHGSIWSLDSGLFRFRDAGQTLVSARFDKLNADMTEWNASFQSSLDLTIVEVDYRLLAGYTDLGEFIFTESENYAYRNERKIRGSACHATGGFLARTGDSEFGLTGGFRKIRIGEDDELVLPIFSGSAGWRTPIGKISGWVRLEGEDAGFDMEYAFEGFFDRTGFEIRAVFEQNENSVIGAGITLLNFKRDLEVGALFRYGLVFPVYQFLCLRAEKTLGPVKLTLGFAPSFVENSLISAGITVYFNETGP